MKRYVTQSPALQRYWDHDERRIRHRVVQHLTISRVTSMAERRAAPEKQSRGVLAFFHRLFKRAA